jgi:nitrate reductase (cytochrome), electron transfer subunit
MKRSFLLAALLAALVGCATTVSDTDFSLHKGSVFEPTTPATFDFDTGGAGKSLLEPLVGSGMPPMISHPIADYLPITAASNNCLTCHDRPAEWGKVAAKGQGAAAPASHYTKGPQGKPVVAGAQYNCVACHAPQAGVTPLVGNLSR